jgi:predicted ATPase/DNA-binding winged helix-turn-helix (wHTH) protein
VSAFIELADGRIDLTHRQVHRADGVTGLTVREAHLLTYLAERAGQTVSRETLLVDVWGYHPNAQTRTIDTTVRRVRTKIEADPAAPTVLLTVHGEGYQLVLPTVEGAPIGRGALAARLATLRPGVHTLVGPGGIGKTCLAAHWGADLFIDLSPTDDLAGVLRVVATALDVPVAGDTAAALAQLGFAWAARGPTRVVLDNAEQVRAAVHACLTVWRSSTLTWLVTSREPLQLAEEGVIGVPPLEPADAARLFAERAARAEATRDTAAVTRLMQRLDHLPLAIELAAARTTVLDAAQMAERLDGSLAVLRDRDAERPARHRSLDAALEGSWRLLSPLSQAGLRACAWFRGGFDLPAAEAVLGADAIDVLDDLLARQLIVRRGDRFTLLETVRTYVAQHPVSDITRQAHARYYVERAEAEPQSVPAEFANLQVAQQGAPPWSIRAGLALLPDLHRRGPLSLHTRIAFDTAAGAEVWGDKRLLMRALYARADVHRAAGETDAALADGRRALALAEAIDDGPWRARILARLGAIARYARQPDTARTWFEAAEAQIEQTPDAAVEADVLRRHAALLFELSAFEAAEKRDLRAIALLRRLGDVATEAVVLGNLGNVYLDAGREAEAQPLYTRALTLHRRLDDHRFEAIVGANRALALHLSGALDDAFEQAQSALTQHRRIGNRRFEGFCHYLLGGLHHERGDLEAALECLGATLRIWQSIGEKAFTGFAHARLAVLEAERGAPGLARQALAEAERRLQTHAGPGLAVHAAIVEDVLTGQAAALPVAQGTTFARVGLRLRAAIHKRGRHA